MSEQIFFLHNLVWLKKWVWLMNMTILGSKSCKICQIKYLRLTVRHTYRQVYLIVIMMLHNFFFLLLYIFFKHTIYRFTVKITDTQEFMPTEHWADVGLSNNFVSYFKLVCLRFYVNFLLAQKVYLSFSDWHLSVCDLSNVIFFLWFSKFSLFFRTT